MEGRVKIIERGIRATRRVGEGALNKGFLEVYNKCSLKNCDVK